MASLGYYLLLAAFVSGAYAAAISVAGARRRSRRLIDSGTGAFYLTMAIMLAASAAIVPALGPGPFLPAEAHRAGGLVGHRSCLRPGQLRNQVRQPLLGHSAVARVQADLLL